jgi:hypothetical protein
MASNLLCDRKSSHGHQHMYEFHVIPSQVSFILSSPLSLPGWRVAELITSWSNLRINQRLKQALIVVSKAILFI